jgi:nicotinamide-nucleotide amidase
LKKSVLGVADQTLDQFGAISKETAIEMANGVLERTKATYAVAVTGNAGPCGDEGKPIGLTFVAVVDRRGNSLVRELQLHGDRDTIKQRAVKQALYSVWAVINNRKIE